MSPPRLVQIFRLVKESNCKAKQRYAEDLTTQSRRKRCAKMGGEMGKGIHKGE